MMLIELTLSELMALRDLLTEHLACPNATGRYIDWTVEPPVETTPEQLLALLLEYPTP